MNRASNRIRATRSLLAIILIGFQAMAGAAEKTGEAVPTFADGLAIYDAAIKSREPMHPGFARALEIWRPHVSSGHAGAAYHVGLFHYLGVGGLVVDQGRGIRLIREAATNGYATAQAFMGLLAERGDGTAVVRSQEEAVRWYTSAAQGNQCAGIKWLAQAYERGDMGLSKSESEARLWRDKIPGCRKR